MNNEPLPLEEGSFLSLKCSWMGCLLSKQREQMSAHSMKCAMTPAPDANSLLADIYHSKMELDLAVEKE